MIETKEPSLMKVESRKAFQHGFVLYEPDLRRFADTIRDQFGKLHAIPDLNVSYQIKFRNGAIAETISLDEVLSLENSGSGRIVSLNCEYANKGDHDESCIHLSFINADEEDSSDSVAIRYLVRAIARLGLHNEHYARRACYKNKAIRP